MHELITPKGAIRYEIAGRGPAVVFLHSALTDHRQWRAQVDALSRDYRCIAYDLLGHGLSGNAPDNCDPADTLLALLDHLEVATATLVGSSLGGSITIHAAVRFPERVQSLIVVGTGLFGFQPELNAPEPSIYAEYEAAWSAHDVNRLVDLAEVIWLVGIDGSAQHVSQANRESFRMMYREYLHNHGEFAQYRDIHDADSVANLDIPAMVVIGEQYTAFCVAVADYLEHTLPRATIFRIPNAAHFPNLSQPQAVNELLRQWLKETHE